MDIKWGLAIEPSGSLPQDSLPPVRFHLPGLHKQLHKQLQTKCGNTGVISHSNPNRVAYPLFLLERLEMERLWGERIALPFGLPDKPGLHQEHPVGE